MRHTSTAVSWVSIEPASITSSMPARSAKCAESAFFRCVALLDESIGDNAERGPLLEIRAMSQRSPRIIPIPGPAAIVAGLIVGLSLGIQSADGAHAKAGVDPAASAARVHVSAPWFIAMNAGHSARTRGTLAGYLRETDLIVSS